MQAFILQYTLVIMEIKYLIILTVPVNETDITRNISLNNCSYIILIITHLTDGSACTLKSQYLYSEIRHRNCRDLRVAGTYYYSYHFQLFHC